MARRVVKTENEIETPVKETEVKEVKPTKAKTTKAATPKVENTEIKIDANDLMQVLTNLKTTENTELNDNTVVTVQSKTYGTLFYRNRRTQDSYKWKNYGETQDITVGDLRDIKSNQIMFLEKGCFSLVGCPQLPNVTVDDVAKFLGIQRYFSEDFSPDLNEVLVKWTEDEIERKVPLMSKATKENLKIMFSGYAEENKIDSLRKISALEKALNITIDIQGR